MKTDIDYLQDALHTFNGGNWYGWKTHDSNGDKIPSADRMAYAHIKIIKEGATIPSEADVNVKIQELKDADAAVKTKRINDKASANAKLKALGLTDDEIEAIK